MKKRTFSIKKFVALFIFGGLFMFWACQNQTSTEGATDPLANASGEELYVSYCQICHGSKDEAGPMAEVLKQVPLDLSLIKVRRGGEFPRKEIVKIIEGGSTVKGHRNVEMPAFGKTFKESENLDNKKMVQKRINRIVDYLESIQRDLEG